jgi:hypothetical protein
MAVPVGAEGTFRAGSPVALFSAHLNRYGSAYDVSSDGRRFLVNSLPAGQGSPPLELLVQWTALLKKN